MLIQFVSNDKLRQTLTATAREGRLPHAVILQGPAGTGRFTLARLLAQTILCRGERKPCGVCGQCRKVEQGIHPDVEVLGGEDKSNSFHIDVIRKLKEQAYISPNEGEKRIYILQNAQSMTVQAQNALLKILEEPPAHSIFILTCKNASILLETIRSRCALFTVQPAALPDCILLLRERLPEQALDKIERAAEYAGGNIGRALQLLGDAAQFDLYEMADAFSQHLRDEFEVLRVLSSFERKKGLLPEFLETARSIIGHNAVLACGHGGRQSIPTPLQAASIVDIINSALEMTRQNVSTPLLTAKLSKDIACCANGRQDARFLFD